MKIGRYEITGKNLIVLFSALVVMFVLYTRGALPSFATLYLPKSIMLVLFMVICVLLNPPKSKAGKIIIWLLTAVGLVGGAYPAIIGHKLTIQMFSLAPEDVPFFFLFLIGFVAVLTRVGGGRIILGMVAVIIIYLFLPNIPGIFGHKALPLTYIASILFTRTEMGAYGFFTDVAFRVIAIFMVFAALLITSGLGELFNAVATWVAGGATGGPAKISVFSSGLFGMLSGSPVANVAATGSFTIPLMKRVGYSPTAAATVEALASTGGNIMPPIMGVAAFLMAEILGIPYFRVCVAAIVPVFLWYFTCWLLVHYYALRRGIKKWRPSKQEFMQVIKAKYHLGFAVIGLIAALALFSAAPEQAAFWAVIFLVLLTCARKDTRLNWTRIKDFLLEFARMYAPLYILIVALGIFIGGMMGTGVHLKLGQVLLGGIESWYFILLIAFGLIVVLGMALPITATYIGAAAILAPILVGMGYNALVVHMFVFYVATLAPITPPVALASYTAARIAGAGMMRTGLEATLRGLPLWIIPFAIFRYNLLFTVGTPLIDIGIGVAILCAGIFIFTVGANGYFNRNLSWFERVLAMLVGVMIVQPLSDYWTYVFMGVAAFLVVFWLVSRPFKKLAGKQGEASVS